MLMLAAASPVTGPPPDPGSAVWWGLHFIDTSTEGAINGIRADETARIAMAEDFIAEDLTARGFTLMEPPAASITTPPVRIDKQCRIARISCTVGTPGTQAVRATVDGTTITVGAGSSQGTVSTNITKQAGNVIRVTIGATDAAGIVVSLRIEEPGVLPS